MTSVAPPHSRDRDLRDRAPASRRPKSETWLTRYAGRVRGLFGGDDGYALMIAAVTGTLTGFGALGFRYLVDSVTRVAFGNDSVFVIKIHA